MLLHFSAAVERACWFLGFLPVFAIAFAASPAIASDDPSGVWLTQAGDARVQVSRCGRGICGRVVWLKTPIDPATGKRAVDDKNENPALRSRPIVGLPLFLGMSAVAANKWTGRIYNADDGKSYASNVTLSGPQTLDVQGCMGAICGGETWTRVGR